MKMLTHDCNISDLELHPYDVRTGEKLAGISLNPFTLKAIIFHHNYRI